MNHELDLLTTSEMTGAQYKSWAEDWIESFKARLLSLGHDLQDAAMMAEEAFDKELENVTERDRRVIRERGLAELPEVSEDIVERFRTELEPY